MWSFLKRGHKENTSHRPGAGAIIWIPFVNIQGLQLQLPAASWAISTRPDVVVITAIGGHRQVPNSTIFGADKCPTLVFSPSAFLDEYLSFQCLEQGDIDFICVIRHHWG